MKISIVTPSYNQVKYISRTIESIITQKGEFDLEYIIVDGMSTDGSAEEIRKYASLDNRIKCIFELDSNQSEALNKGFKLASGDIIGWINSDDILLPNALASVSTFFKQNINAKWMYSFCKIINENDQEIFKSITKYKYHASKVFSYKRLLMENFISQPTVFFTKKLFLETGGVDQSLNFCMDYDLWLRFSNISHPIILDQTISCFRRYPQSKSGSSYKAAFKEQYHVAKKYTKSSIILCLHQIFNIRNISCYLLIDLIIKCRRVIQHDAKK